MRWPLVRVAVVEQSMEPTLRPGDWLVGWRTRRVRAGQVVIARHPDRRGMLLVKRAARLMPDGGGWWLESDNPGAQGAADSWRFGAVAPDLIEGRVLFRYWRPRDPGSRRSPGSRGQHTGPVRDGRGL